jgi:hypothetical protein
MYTGITFQSPIVSSWYLLFSKIVPYMWRQLYYIFCYRLDVLGLHFNDSAKVQMQHLLQVMRQIQAPSLGECHMHHILLDKKAMGDTRNLRFLVIKLEVCTMYFMDLVQCKCSCFCRGRSVRSLMEGMQKGLSSYPFDHLNFFHCRVLFCHLCYHFFPQLAFFA